LTTQRFDESRINEDVSMDSSEFSDIQEETTVRKCEYKIQEEPSKLMTFSKKSQLSLPKGLQNIGNTCYM
jgi:ubiquitin C-terminal hydrolase